MLRPWASIVFGSIALGVALGVSVDLVTAHVAVEYFSVYHAQIINSRSPWLLALAWGFAATWWAGAIAGGVLALWNARLRPPVPASVVLRWIAWACVGIWITMMAILAGVYGIAGLIPTDQRRPSFEHGRRLMAVAVAHMTEYGLAALAALLVGLMMRAESRRAGTSHS